MITLAWLMLRAAGWPRHLLVVASTSFVSGMLLVVVALLRLPEQPDEDLFKLIAMPGTRAGAALAGALSTIPALLLLYQAVRLGAASRDRRLAGMTIVGATAREVRFLGAVEVGLPAAVGSLLGIAVYRLARLLLGGTADGDLAYVRPVTLLRLVPTSVVPTGWDLLLVVLGVSAVGAVIGWQTSRAVVTSPVSVTRRQPRAAPRPWGVLLVVAGAVLLWFTWAQGVVGSLALLAAVALGALGVTSLASWLGFRVAQKVEGLTASTTLLLAARRIITDPRAIGRAAAAVGAVGLVAGGTGALVLQLVLGDIVESFYLISVVLVLVLLGLALLFVCVTMAVHGVESLLERRRETAALIALGMGVEELERSHRQEAALVAMPMAAVGVLLGSLSYAGTLLLFAETETPLLLVLAAIAATTVGVLATTLALVWLAITIAVALLRPWFRRAAATANLRTE